MDAQVRTRIAPSPTGNLHVGTARAALYNEIFARQNNGTFILRVEDTDRERSKQEYEEKILEGLKWLGLEWDEGPDVGGDYGPYRQTERLEKHKQAISLLLEKGLAYKDAESEAIYLKVPDKEVLWTDMIRGEVKTHPDAWGGDFVIARSINDPVFHLAVVVDDADQEITHVIRGEDHTSNTARHVLIQEALGLPRPKYAHLPLLLDQNRKKLSKRTGETNLFAYKEMGIIPEAMFNYLALLGWNPGGNEEILSKKAIIEKFRLEKVQKGGAIFDLTKLASINRQYLNQLDDAGLYEWGKDRFDQQKIEIQDKARFVAAVKTERERTATNIDLETLINWYAPDWKSEFITDLVWRDSDKKTTGDLLTRLIEEIHKLDEKEFSADLIEKELINWIEKENLGKGDVLWPMRVALTDKDKSPSPFEIAAVIGKDDTLMRLKKAVEYLKA